MSQVQLCGAGRVATCEPGRVARCGTPVDVGLWVCSTGSLPIPTVWSWEACGARVEGAWTSFASGADSPAPSYLPRLMDTTDPAWPAVAAASVPGATTLDYEVYVYCDGLSAAEIRAAYRAQLPPRRWYGASGPLYRPGGTGGPVPLRWSRVGGVLRGYGFARCNYVVWRFPDQFGYSPVALSSLCCDEGMYPAPWYERRPSSWSGAILDLSFPAPIAQWSDRWYPPGTEPPDSSNPAIYPGNPSSISIEVVVPSGRIEDIYSTATQVRVRYYVPYCYSGGPMLVENQTGGQFTYMFLVHLDYVFASAVIERSFRFTSAPAPTGFFELQNPPMRWISGSGFLPAQWDPMIGCAHRQFEPPWTCNYWAQASDRRHHVQIYQES